MAPRAQSERIDVPNSALARVTYDLFEGETPESLASSHEIDREWSLEFENRTRLFVSWAHLPIQSCVNGQRVPHFDQSSQARVDCSDSPLWRPLIGKALTLEFADSERQTLCIRCSSGTVHVCSWARGHWYADTLTITNKAPSR